MSGSSTYYFHTDHLGGTNVISDSTGSAKQIIEYMPYGEIARKDKIGSSEEIAWWYFTGQHLDDETGLYYYNARYYNPVLGRFIQPDTLVPYPDNPQSFNRYAYCHNNPVNLIDPDGHNPFKWLKKNVIDPVCNFFNDLFTGFFNWLEDITNSKWYVDIEVGHSVSFGSSSSNSTGLGNGENGGNVQFAYLESHQVSLEYLSAFLYLNGGVVAGINNNSGFATVYRGFRGIIESVGEENISLFLDVVGLIPVVGEPADIVNGILYSIQGDKTNAALSFGSAIPMVGWLGAAGKATTKARVFWSGGDVAQNAASKWAKANNALTLDMTLKGKYLDFMDKITRGYNAKAWKKASINFAEGASGDVKVFHNANGIRRGSIWAKYEYPALKNNSDVGTLIYENVR